MDHEENLDYQRVSPKLIPLRQIHHGLLFGILLVATTIGLLVVDWVTEFFATTPLAYFAWLVPAALLIGGLITILSVIPRQVRAMGYLEHPDDLLLRRGILFRDQVAVPYGRIQYVDIRQGPLQRAFGITYIVITTAGGGTASTFEGLPMAEAERLRDDLTQRGQARLEALEAA